MLPASRKRLKRTEFDVETGQTRFRGYTWLTALLYLLVAIPVINYYVQLVIAVVGSNNASEERTQETFILPSNTQHADNQADNQQAETITVGADSWSKWIDTTHDELVAPELGCGGGDGGPWTNWQKEYADLHAKIIALPKDDPNRRLYIFDATCCGMSDRWQSFVSAFSYALLTDRAIRIKWGEQGLLEKAYFYPYVNWTYDESIDTGPDDQILNVDDGNTRDKSHWFHDLDLQDLGRDKRIVRWTIAAGQLANFVNNPLYTHKLVNGYGFKTSAIFRCFFNYLVRPRLEVMELVRPQLRELGTTPVRVLHSYKTFYDATQFENSTAAWKPDVADLPTAPNHFPPSNGINRRPYRIGIQIRMGDNVWDGENDRCKGSLDILEHQDTRVFFECAKEVERYHAAGWNTDGFESVIKRPGVAGVSRLLEERRGWKQPVQWYLLTDCAILRVAAVGWIPNIGGTPGVSKLQPLKDKPASDHGAMRWQQQMDLGTPPTFTDAPPRQIVTFLDADSIHHIHHELGDAEQIRFLRLAAAESWMFGLMDAALVTDWSTFGRVGFSRSRAFGGGSGRGGGKSGGSGMWKLGNHCNIESELPWDHVGI